MIAENRTRVEVTHQPQFIPGDQEHFLFKLGLTVAVATYQAHPSLLAVENHKHRQVTMRFKINITLAGLKGSDIHNATRKST